MSPPTKIMKKRASAGAMMSTVLLDLDMMGESSSDSDFRIEDHEQGSDFSDDNSNDDDDGGSGNEDDNEDDDDDSDEGSENDFSLFKNSLSGSGGGGGGGGGSSNSNNTKQSSTIDSKKPIISTTTSLTAKELIQQAKAKEALARAHAKLLATPICCACLGDRSDDTNEIVECDNCGISVHEGCYGISDSTSVSSTVSSCSTEPWFCEACKANIDDPVCELCPNKGGIFKETDVGKWVHLVCALYVPGVAFGEVDLLSSVTLFEMPYSKWGAKSCSICEDIRFARTGVCIGCDAGMCKTYFHVTCAQQAGLLSEAHSEEADHADPFYAHCKIHSDKALIKNRKRNFNGLRLKLNHRLLEQEQKKIKIDSPTVELQRIERKLKKHRAKYITNKSIKQEPWVPTQKMPRLLTTSASACRKLILKAELMGIDTAAEEFQEAQMAALADVRKKWHIPPAFSVEFIGYYLDRISRLKEIKISLQVQLESNKKLVDEQQILRDKYDENIKIQAEHSNSNTMLRTTIERLHSTILALCPNKNLPPIENIGRPVQPIIEQIIINTPPARPMSVPTAAALKMGVGFPLTNLPGTHEDPNRILSTQCQNNSKLMYECGICKKCVDQHLLAKCDTCHLHYHLGCLNPPLTRHPKKSKLYGWQCSECVKSDDSDAPVTLPTGPRKSRTKYSKDGIIVPVDPPQTSDAEISGQFVDIKTLATKLLPKSASTSPSRIIKSPTVNKNLLSDGQHQITSPARPPLSPSISLSASASPNYHYHHHHRSATTKSSTTTKKTFIVDDFTQKQQALLIQPSVKIEQVLVPVPVIALENIMPHVIHNQSITKVMKRKKVKKSATVAVDNDDAMVAANCHEVADGDPLDITNNELLIIPKVSGNKSLTSIAIAATSQNNGNEINAKISTTTTTKGTTVAASIPSLTTKMTIQHQQQQQKKSNKKSKKDKFEENEYGITTKPSYYIDQNGILNCLPQKPEQFIAEIIPNGGNTRNGSVSDIQNESLIDNAILHKPNRKRRKEKHRNKHNSGCDIGGNGVGITGGVNTDGGGGASGTNGIENDGISIRSTNGSPPKEHKKKRKKKNHDMENPKTVSNHHHHHHHHHHQSSFVNDSNDGIPRIKIKFKTLPLPGEPATEPHFFYVSADMVRPKVITKRSASVDETINSFQNEKIASKTNTSVTNSIATPASIGITKPQKSKGPAESLQSPIMPPPAKLRALAQVSPPKPASIRSRRMSMINPRKLTSLSNSFGASIISPSVPTGGFGDATTTTTSSSSQNSQTNNINGTGVCCDVCHLLGNDKDIVRCDECRKNYHFQCLDPPVKKTPKRRGYSWHCADCDPTDVDSN